MSWIEELYIKEQINKKTMNLKINIVEASAELAEERVKEIFTENNKSKTEKEVEEMIFQDDGSDTGSTIYTDEAQELFNTHYDYFFDVLINSKV